MENESSEAMPVVRRKPFVLLRIWQWIVAGCYGLLTILIAGEWSKLTLPGAPGHLYWPAVAILGALAILHIPPVFFRLGKWPKAGAYLGLLGGFVLAGAFLGQMQAAYSRTPQGAKEAAIAAAELAKANAKEARRAESQKKTAELAKLNRELAEVHDKLKGCMSWSGRLPALESIVQNSLHNPESFEHVRTDLIVPDESRRNVVMEFRGENGFGAIRTAQVKAQLSPDTCEVFDISEPVTG